MGGTLRDEAGTAISGATVTIASKEVRKSATTGADGKFRFVKLPPDRYKLSIRYNRREAVDPEAIDLRSVAPAVEIVISKQNLLSVKSSSGEPEKSGGEELSSRAVSELL